MTDLGTNHDDWFITSSGRNCYVCSPVNSDINITDIAHALGRICRFGGHVRRGVEHYSVAQHSVIVSQLVPPELRLVALLHDATEAYLGDLIRPLKTVLADSYKPLERAWAKEIGFRYGVGDALAKLDFRVKAADNLALQYELRDLTEHSRGCDGPSPLDIQPMSAAGASVLFLTTFHELYEGKAP